MKIYAISLSLLQAVTLLCMDNSTEINSFGTQLSRKHLPSTYTVDTLTRWTKNDGETSLNTCSIVQELMQNLNDEQEKVSAEKEYKKFERAIINTSNKLKIRGRKVNDKKTSYFLDTLLFSFGVAYVQSIDLTVTIWLTPVFLSTASWLLHREWKVIKEDNTINQSVEKCKKMSQHLKKLKKEPNFFKNPTAISLKEIVNGSEIP